MLCGLSACEKVIVNAEKTLQSYAEHFHAAGKYIDWSRINEEICMTEINNMISALRDLNLSPRAIAAYVIACKTFFMGQIGQERKDVQKSKYDETDPRTR